MAEGASQVVSATNWDVAFSECGLGRRQTGCSRSLRERLEWTTEIPRISQALPSLEQLQKIIPPAVSFPLDGFSMFASTPSAEGGRLQNQPPVRTRTDLHLRSHSPVILQPKIPHGVVDCAAVSGAEGLPSASAASGSSSSALPRTSPPAPCPSQSSLASPPAAPMLFA